MNSKTLTKNHMIDLCYILFGSFLASIGINMFLIHAKLLSGGLSGIALIIQYLFKVQAGYVILVLNIPLFIISIKKLNKMFTLYSAVGTITLSVFLILTHPISNILNINDKLLYCIYGGVINGIAFGLIFTHHGSTGGFDIVSMLIKQKHHDYNIGNISFSSNIIIVTVSAVIFGLSNALYTLIAMYITSFVLDKVVKGLNRSKEVIIITEHTEEVAKTIMEKLHRGVTYLYGEGAYTKEQKKILYCIIPLSQLPVLREIVKAKDVKAFFTISDVSEIQGKGFKNEL